MAYRWPPNVPPYSNLLQVSEINDSRWTHPALTESYKEQPLNAVFSQALGLSGSYANDLVASLSNSSSGDRFFIRTAATQPGFFEAFHSTSFVSAISIFETGFNGSPLGTCARQVEER